MFLKHFKYDFLSNKINFLFLCFVQIIFAIIVRIKNGYGTYIFDKDNIFYFVIYVPLILILFFTIKSLSSKLFSESSYPLHSTPARTGTIIIAKVFSSFLKVFIILIIFFIGYEYETDLYFDKYYYISYLLKNPSQIAMYAFSLLLMIYLIIFLSSYAYLIYKGEHQMIFLIIFIVCTIAVITIYTMVIVYPIGEWIQNRFSESYPAMMVLIIVLYLPVIIFFLSPFYIVKKKLNL